MKIVKIRDYEKLVSYKNIKNSVKKPIYYLLINIKPNRTSLI